MRLTIIAAAAALALPPAVAAQQQVPPAPATPRDFVLPATRSFSLAAVNDAPTDLTLTGGSVVENAANNTVVGSVAAVDEPANTHTYSLVDNAGGRFAINAATGEIRVANGILLNYEAASSHNITVKAVDQGGLEYQEV